MVRRDLDSFVKKSVNVDKKLVHSKKGGLKLLTLEILSVGIYFNVNVLTRFCIGLYILDPMFVLNHYLQI